MKNENPAYLRQLDGIRFIAVTMVMIHHWAVVFIDNQAIEKITFPISYLGVCMFFVLSGFLITRILLIAKQKDQKLDRNHGFSLKQFYIRRTIRIFPIYYLTIFLLFLLNVEPVRDKIWWCLTYSTNIFVAFKHTWFGSIDHLWSLAVEEQFYLFFPFVVFLFPTNRLVKILIGLILLSVLLRLYFFLSGTPWMTAYVLMPTCLDAFGLGGLLAYFYFTDNQRVKEVITNKKLLISSLIAYFFVVFLGNKFSVGHNFFTDVLLRLFESIFSVLLVGNAVYGFGGFLKKGLENSAVSYLGKISYGLYIYHFLVYNPYHSTQSHWVVRALNKLPLIANNLPLKIIFLYTLTVILATFSWFIIEKPINHLKDKFGY